MKKPTILLLACALALALAAPAKASITVNPPVLPMLAPLNGTPVTQKVTVTVSPKETKRNLTAKSILGSTDPYGQTNDCPDVFPDSSEDQECVVEVTMDPRKPGLAVGFYPAELRLHFVEAGNPDNFEDVSVALAGDIVPAPAAPTQTSPTKDKRSIKDKIREERERRREGKHPRKGAKTGGEGAKKRRKGRCAPKKGKKRKKGAKRSALASAKKKGKKKGKRRCAPRKRGKAGAKKK